MAAPAPTPSPLPPAPAPGVDGGHALLCPRVCGLCTCTHPLAPARRRLSGNGLDDAAKQALEAAAGSGLELPYL
eukprot:scaffold51323_cov60-Phaeocystis_antarctica.AAC.1